MTIGNAVLLVDAIQKGDTNQVKDLLGKGIDINMRDTEDRTLLHYAVWYNNPEVLKLLLDKNPDIEAKDSAGRTPLYAAVHSVMVNHANLDLVKFFSIRVLILKLDLRTTITLPCTMLLKAVVLTV